MRGRGREFRTRAFGSTVMVFWFGLQVQGRSLRQQQGILTQVADFCSRERKLRQVRGSKDVLTCYFFLFLLP